MKYYIGVTDNDWFHFLADLAPDEVNFWRPGGQGFGAIQQYEPFLFKLHSPYNFIVGGGFFVRAVKLPVSLAWDVFQEKNGAPDYETLYGMIRGYRESRGTMAPNPVIGNIVLTQPFFFPEEEWIPVPDNWAPNIVSGKTYDTAQPIGARVWDQVQMRLRTIPIEESKQVAEEGPRYGDGVVVHPRLGQGGFRVLVTEAYERHCAVTGESALPVLQASHIKPYARSGPHDVRNGLLLRADLHILFDQGYLTITDDHRVEASRHMKDDFDNGKEYLKLKGQPLAALPRKVVERPSPEFITWHQDNIYRG